MQNHPSSLNSINERYATVEELRTATEVVKKARSVFFSISEGEIKTLPRFGDTFEYYHNFITSLVTGGDPCSEDVYFTIFHWLQKELTIKEAVDFSHIHIKKRVGLYGKFKNYGELEILHEIEDYAGERYYHRHSFILHNEHLSEISVLINLYFRNRLRGIGE